MKRINRRQFAKFMSGTVLAIATRPASAGAVPTGVGASRIFGTAPAERQQSEPPKPDPKLTLTPEQEERVKQAVERRNRQLAPLRARTLPYDLEPAFTFRVRMREAARQGSTEVRRQGL